MSIFDHSSRFMQHGDDEQTPLFKTGKTCHVKAKGPQSFRPKRFCVTRCGLAALMLTGLTALATAQADQSLPAVPQALVNEQTTIRSTSPRSALPAGNAWQNQPNVDGLKDGVTNPSRMTLTDRGQTVMINSGTQSTINADSLGRLIADQNRKYDASILAIEQKTRIRPANPFGGKLSQSIVVQDMSFDQWLAASAYRQAEVASYQRYLAQRVGLANVPPMDQLLTSARDWAACGYDKYQLPPRELWQTMVPTLQLYANLKSQGILPPTTEVRSVYRPPALNACAGGAKSSKHLTNGAMDVWVPDYQYNNWLFEPMQDRLCQFWQTQGAAYEFGLGVYATGSVHLDTQGHRKWGQSNTPADSACR